MPEPPKHTIFPISDSALTIDFGNRISESINLRVLSLFRKIQKDPLPGMIEVIPAYCSLTIYYDLFQLRKLVPAGKTVCEWMVARLEQKVNAHQQINDLPDRLVHIPVCYEKEFAPDIEVLAKEKNISVDDVIRIHTLKQYRVYMLGFLPGFAYMGEVDERIVIRRKSQPITVATGSVGIAGKQTGIYPLASPGGWQIIGRTPLKLFNAAPPNLPEGKASVDPVCLLHPGDKVQFISISKNEFENY